jgi:hypothetical protein
VAQTSFRTLRGSPSPKRPSPPVLSGSYRLYRRDDLLAAASPVGEISEAEIVDLDTITRTQDERGALGLQLSQRAAVKVFVKDGVRQLVGQRLDPS